MGSELVAVSLYNGDWLKPKRIRVEQIKVLTSARDSGMTSYRSCAFQAGESGVTLQLLGRVGFVLKWWCAQSRCMEVFNWSSVRGVELLSGTWDLGSRIYSFIILL